MSAKTASRGWPRTADVARPVDAEAGPAGSRAKTSRPAGRDDPAQDHTAQDPLEPEHGALTRAEAAGVLGRDELAAGLREGRWVQPWPGVVVPARRARDPLTRKFYIPILFLLFFPVGWEIYFPFSFRHNLLTPTPFGHRRTFCTFSYSLHFPKAAIRELVLQVHFRATSRDKTCLSEQVQCSQLVIFNL